MSEARSIEELEREIRMLKRENAEHRGKAIKWRWRYQGLASMVACSPETEEELKQLQQERDRLRAELRQALKDGDSYWKENRELKKRLGEQ